MANSDGSSAQSTGPGPTQPLAFRRTEVQRSRPDRGQKIANLKSLMQFEGLCKKSGCEFLRKFGEMERRLGSNDSLSCSRCGDLVCYVLTTQVACGEGTFDERHENWHKVILNRINVTLGID
jgi:hypothetical protein